MKQTINFSSFCDAFRSYGRNDQFTYSGKSILFEYLEQLEEDIGEEIDLDVIGLCCDYSEDSAEVIARDYSIDIDGLDDDEILAAVLDYLNENTQVCGTTTDGLIVYAQF